MAELNTEGLTPMQLGRLHACLAKVALYDGQVRTLGQHLAILSGVKKEGDGYILWSRAKFNRMDAREQRAYEARLKAKRFYYVDGWQVPKIVWDAVIPAPDILAAADRANAEGAKRAALERVRREKTSRRDSQPMPEGGLFDEVRRAQQELF